MKDNNIGIGNDAQNSSLGSLADLLLDSKLISATSKSLYDIKIVDCGEYIQAYFYHNGKIKTNKKDKSDLELRKILDNGFINDKTVSKSNILKTSNEIDIKNIIRSKLMCQRIAKANIKDWETFITLTFADNITNVKDANKRFKYFVDKIRRVKKDFKYLCITEFQKRGAIHYHLLCNISINDEQLIYKQQDNPKYKHIKYWLEGFTSVEEIKGDAKKIVGYISKYMTKDIDNRLFNRHRFFSSMNLNKPCESYINSKNKKERDYCIKKIQDTVLIYKNDYINSYDKSKVTFLEYIKK